MEIQGKYVKNMRKYKGTIIALIVCMIFAYLYAHVDKKEYFYNRTVDVEKYANTGVICEKKAYAGCNILLKNRWMEYRLKHRMSETALYKNKNYNSFSEQYIIEGFDEQVRRILIMMMAQTCREFEETSYYKIH